MRKLLAPTLNQSQSAWPELEKGRSSSSSGGGTSTTRRSGTAWLLTFFATLYSYYAVYNYQFESLPAPLTAEQAGDRGFSEVEALKHVAALSQLGPRPVGSQSLDRALQCVLSAAEEIKETADPEVGVEVDVFRAESGANRLGSGAFEGKTLVYSDLTHIVLRVTPKNKYVSSEAAEDNAILVSAHVDTAFS
ncbi:hypothetical protein Tsubulata_050850, partial [Turnera subulata]